METILQAVDREIRQELYDSERSIKVLGRVCQNDPNFFRSLWPFALASLVDVRIAAIAPPTGKPMLGKPRKKRVKARSRG
jgi:hypothetical protein